MTADQLLAELEVLNHAARTRRMTLLGRQPETQREPILNGLAGGSAYERRLALASTFGSGDARRVVQAAVDPSGSVHGPATRQVARLCSGEQLLHLLQELPASRHRPLLAHWSRARRPAAPVDAWIDALLQNDRRGEVWPLLAYASPERVAGLLKDALTEGFAPDWARLTRWHPGLIAQELLRQAQASSEPNPALTVRINAVLGLLAKRESGLALELLREMERTTPLGSLHVQPLAAVAAPELAALMLESADQARLSLTGQLGKLSAEQVGALMRQRPSLLPAAERAFTRLSAARRRELAPDFLAALTSAEGVLPFPLAASLPADLRVSEARRHLALPILQTRPLVRLPYAGLLPWDEARAVLDAPLRGPDADTRGEALSALIFSLRYERGRQSELLAMLTARRNEQDPVRNRMLNGLSALPPGLWQPESLDALGEVIQAALNAADLSPGTAQAAERVLVGLLPFQPGWGAAWLAKLVQVRGQVNLGRLETRLTTGTAATLVAALLPVLRTWETREREGQLLGALRSLGRFVNDSPEVLALLERLVQRSVVVWTGVGALAVLAEHAPQRFVALVPQLLERDGSWATQPLVYTHLHRYRQDLLPPYLGRQSFRGRFSTGRTRFVLPFAEGFQRWTLSQQQVFAQTLIDVSRDSVRDNPGVFSVLRQLAALPSPVPLNAAPLNAQEQPARPSLLARLTGAATRPTEDPPLRRLIELADLRNENLALRDTALRMLGRLDEGRGLPALLDTLDDDRARISIYVLRRPLLNLPPAAALTLLLQVPQAKVTVFKEVVRLVGELPGEAAYRALLGFSAQELHRDVRIALLRGLWNHLNRPETWPLLLAAARSPDAALSDGLVRLPAQNVRAEYQDEYLTLFRALLTHPDPLVRQETLRFQSGVTDPERRLLGTLLESLASPHAEEAQAAAQLVFASYTGRDALAVAAAFSGLLPQRRALVGAVNALQAAASASRLKAAPLVRAILTALAADPLTLHLQARLVISTLPWPEVAERLLGWAAGGELHADALTAAVNAVTGARNRTDTLEIETLERPLASGPPVARRLALAALVLAAQAPGTWTPERLARLREYRADPSLLVAGAAQFTLPDAELAAEG